MNKRNIRIGLDAMSGDLGAKAVVPAALKALDQFPDLYLTLVGLEEVLQELTQGTPQGSAYLKSGRLIIHPCTQVVEMADSPQMALKNKKDSSMRVAINLVKNETVSACVSAGNTGALMATARFVLKMLPGIERPAICTALPTMKAHIHMLDLGANVDSSAEHLYQFALMGSILAQTVDGIASPKVGLLNIGSEAMKGNEQVKAASVLLEPHKDKATSALNYIGYIEANDIFSKDINVVVADGFVGNVALKTIEGTSKLFTHFLSLAFKQNFLTKLAGLVAMPVLKALKKRVDPRKYNGASLLGLNGIVVKSHGNADEFAYYSAIVIAMRQVEQKIIEKLRLQFALPDVEDQVNNQVGN